MDLLTGYESEGEAECSPVESSTSVSAPIQPPSAAFLSAAAAATIGPDPTPLPPGQMRPSARAETDEERKARKALKQEKKEKKAAKAAATAAAPPKAKLVLPSAATLLSGLGASSMGLLQSGNEADSEGGSPAPGAFDPKKKYNALPPPASLLAGDQLSDAEQWRMKPMQLDKKRRFDDFPAPAAATTTTTAAAATPAASAGGAVAAAHRHFAPPQVARKKANVATEDSSNWNVAKRRSLGQGASPDAATAGPLATSNGEQQ